MFIRLNKCKKNHRAFHVNNNLPQNRVEEQYAGHWSTWPPLGALRPAMHHFICLNVYSYVREIFVPGDGVINIYFFNCE
jgi:hypothetical protein